MNWQTMDPWLKARASGPSEPLSSRTSRPRELCTSFNPIPVAESLAAIGGEIEHVFFPQRPKLLPSLHLSCSVSNSASLSAQFVHQGTFLARRICRAAEHTGQPREVHASAGGRSYAFSPLGCSGLCSLGTFFLPSDWLPHTEMFYILHVNP